MGSPKPSITKSPLKSGASTPTSTGGTQSSSPAASVADVAIAAKKKATGDQISVKIGVLTWVRKVDPNTNRTYFFNTRDKKSQWKEPAGWEAAFKMQLEDEKREQRKQEKEKKQLQTSGSGSGAGSSASSSAGDVASKPRTITSVVISGVKWEERFDPKSQRVYYANMHTRTSVWNKPEGWNTAASAVREQP